MAKTKNALPSTGKIKPKSEEATESTDSTAPSQTSPASKNEPDAGTVTTQIVEAPMYHEVLGTPKRRIDVQGLTMKQRSNLQRLKNGLSKTNAKLEDGGDVRYESTAIKWLLENLEELPAAATG